MGRVLFDLYSFHWWRSPSGGGCLYADTVLKHLLDKGAVDELLVLESESNAREIASFKCDYPTLQTVRVSKPSDAASLVEAHNVRKVYLPLVSQPIPLTKSSVPVLVTVHGLRDYEMPTDRYAIQMAHGKNKFKQGVRLLFPDYFRGRSLLKYDPLSIGGGASQLIVVSEHTKSTILSVCPKLSPEDVNVCYSPQKALPSEYDATRAANVISGMGLNRGNYFLLLGADRWMKNSIRAIRAYLKVPAKYRAEIKLVVVGVTKKVERDYKFCAGSSDVVLLPYVESMDLESLYDHAKALFYPSLNEGFGYPPIECMKYGTPVLASSVASIPEVCGDAAIYFNPYLENEMTTRIVSFLTSEELQNSMRKKATDRYRVVSVRQAHDLNRLGQLILS